MACSSTGSTPAPGGESPACVGIWGALFGHRYWARYDERVSHPAWLTEIARSMGQIELRGTILPERERVYVGDVCGRCGHRVERRPVPAAQTSGSGTAAGCLPQGDLPDEGIW